MVNQIFSIINLVLSSFKDIWPYLLITIPLSVIVQMSGVARYIKNALRTRPVTAILLATTVGAFSPFCSCGVIPVIAALLISGVPLAPVMSFWIASPSMDPEIFFLSVAAIGWNLAVWRLISTLFLSLAAGFITHFVIQNNWLDEKKILRSHEASSTQTGWRFVKPGFYLVMKKLKMIKEGLISLFASKQKIALNVNLCDQTVCCGAAASADDNRIYDSVSDYSSCCHSNSLQEPIDCEYCNSHSLHSLNRMLKETWNATYMVSKFMALSFLLKAFIMLYIPSAWIVGLLGEENVYSVFTAAFIGVPMYTSNLAALPLVSGLLAQGMNPAAALAF